MYWPTTDLLMSYESSLEAADNNKKVVTSYDSFTDYGVNVGRLHFGMTTVAPLNIAKNATNKIAVGSTELKNVPFLVPSVTNVKRTTDNTVYNFLQQASISLGKPNSQLPSQSNFVNVYNDQK